MSILLFRRANGGVNYQVLVQLRSSLRFQREELTIKSEDDDCDGPCPLREWGVIRIGFRVLPCRARSRAARAQHGPMYPYCRALKLLLHRRLMMTPELPTIALAAMSGGVPKGIYIHNLFWGFHPRFFEGEDKLLGDSVGGEFFSSSSSSSSCSKNVT